MNTRHTICHVIVRLDTGGAETSLLRLTEQADPRFEHRVICLGRPSEIGAQLQSAGVSVEYFDYRSGPVALWRAGQAMRRAAPAIVQGWMYLGNVIAAMLLRWMVRTDDAALIWSIRQSPNDPRAERWRTRVAMQLARLPGLGPDLVLYNAHAAVARHAYLGYNRFAHKVIVNGIDTQRFRPDRLARVSQRQLLGLTVDTVCVAMVCRYHPLKGVADFLAAMAAVVQNHDVRVLLAGPGMDANNVELQQLLQHHALQSKVQLLGPQRPMEGFLPALDLLVLASHREGTPNILLEALACGVPCVATDVGDVRKILLDEDAIVAAGDVPGLVRTISANLERETDTATQAREHICQHYSIEACLSAYSLTYAELLAP